MENIKKNFGFGCMRLPMKNGEVDTEQTCRMVDAFLENGFNYFDTAHGYLNGKSEGALKTCLTSRYPRDRYILTDKLTNFFFKKQDDIRPLFQSQLEACGVDYFDFYLMHAQGADNFNYFKKCRAYETALELKAEGKIRHFGISFHDRAEVLEQILTEYPQVEVVQIQFNYLDYEDPAVESRKCYEVCRKYGKPVNVVQQGQEEVRRGYKPEIKPLDIDIRNYDVIVVGTPTWWYTMAPAVLTFLHQQNWNGKIVVPFQTHAGWPGHVLEDIAAACRDAKVTCDMQVKFDSNGGDHLETPETEVEMWTQKVKALL
ncbi:MAG TPA: aldo/keto reductase [Candidatus Gallacutalibacter pullistercoris]|nr:aldo/keto reductase [Candidatus Gallacutalibacter pullistercoris]